VTRFAKVNEAGPRARPIPKWTETGPRLLIALGSAAALTALFVLVQLTIAEVTP
jgi:hypothetical protein